MPRALSKLAEVLSSFASSEDADEWVEEDQSWSDFGYEEGCQLVGSFDDADWAELASAVSSYSHPAVHFLSQWLGSSSDPRAIQALVQLLPSSSGSAWLMCAEALGAHLLANPSFARANLSALRSEVALSACTLGFESFTNYPREPDQLFADYFRRYRHMASPEAEALLIYVLEPGAAAA